MVQIHDKKSEQEKIFSEGATNAQGIIFRVSEKKVVLLQHQNYIKIGNI